MGERGSGWQFWGKGLWNFRGFPRLMMIFCQLNYGAGSTPAPYFCWQNQSQDSDGGKGKKSVFSWGKRREVRCVHQCFLARSRRQTALETAIYKMRARFLMRFVRQSALRSPVFFGAKPTINSIRNSNRLGRGSCVSRWWALGCHVSITTRPTQGTLMAMSQCLQNVATLWHFHTYALCGPCDFRKPCEISLSQISLSQFCACNVTRNTTIKRLLE